MSQNNVGGRLVQIADCDPRRTMDDLEVQAPPYLHAKLSE